MYTPYDYGGGCFTQSNWLLLVGIPLIIGMWAQFRVSRAFKKWGEVRASSNITGAEAAREILQAAQIHDVEVVETNDYLGDHYDPTQQTALPFDATSTIRRRWRRLALPRTKPATPSSMPKPTRR